MFDLKGLECAWLRLWESCAAIKDKNLFSEHAEWAGRW